jgi:cytochrome c553
MALALLAGAGNAAAQVARGEHLATVMGCISCHGQDLQGHLHHEDPALMTLWNSNLTLVLPTWSDEQIERTLRTGRRPDGTPLWIMPTFVHQQLSDPDMHALIDWLRSVPTGGERHPAIQRGPQFARALERGFQDSAAQAERLSTRRPVDLGAATRAGRYLATLACAECHGPQLTGVRDPAPGDPPDLVVAAAYTPPELTRLFRTGVTRDGRPAAEMSTEGPKRLSALDSEEIAALAAYLRARAAAPFN